MTAKLIRQPDQLVLVGVPTSAAASAMGVEQGPAALRALGIVDRLKAIGYRVTDAGDLPAQLFHPDPENPRARNLKAVLAILETLRVRIEQAARVHALPLVLGGDETIVLALVAGLRRQAPSLGLAYISRYADLHTPTDTEDGLIGPMTVSHLVGQGAAELVRFWKSPPLVREPDLVVLGSDDTDAVDRSRLSSMAVRSLSMDKIHSLGAPGAAKDVIDYLRADVRDFAVHLSLGVMPSEEMPGCLPQSTGGLSLHEVRELLNLFASRDKFAGLSVSGYNPERDPERRGAGVAVDLIIGAMAARYTALLHPRMENESGEPKSASVENAVSESKSGTA